MIDLVKKIPCVIILLFSVVSPFKGQTFAEDASSWAGEWRSAFSEAGRKNWTPEFTVRYSAGFISEGPLITGCVRIDDSPGDVWFHAAWDPGVRSRFCRNLHLFLGPTIATDRIGLHLGVEF